MTDADKSPLGSPPKRSRLGPGAAATSAERDFEEREPSPATVSFITTEHFVLATARSAGISETNGRAAIFLASVSSGLVALAFIGQISRLGTAFFVFGLVILPTLAFLGVTTFERAIKNGVEDMQAARRINRCRQFYFDTSPGVRPYIVAPVADHPVQVARQAGIVSTSWYQFLTIAGTIGVVTSVISGGVVGLAVQATSGTLGASAAAGVVAGLAVGGAHMVRQRAVWVGVARSEGSDPTEHSV